MHMRVSPPLRVCLIYIKHPNSLRPHKRRPDPQRLHTLRFPPNSIYRLPASNFSRPTRILPRL